MQQRDEVHERAVHTVSRALACVIHVAAAVKSRGDNGPDSDYDLLVIVPDVRQFIDIDRR